MKNYSFDTLLNRHHTDSFRWDFYPDKNILPLTVADMDFMSPPPVLEALKKVVEMGCFGYTHVPEELNQVILKRLVERAGWQVEKDWLIWLPGLIPGINASCRTVGEAGDEVMTAIPVYQPFLLAPGNAQRLLVEVPMRKQNQRWTLDFNRMEELITSKTRLFLLCNPHNPGGTVFNRQELSDLLTLAKKYEFVICSDEIHCDLILDKEKEHIPIATIDEDALHRTITLLAPSKTFNIAGLACSLAIIPHPGLRENFRKAIAGMLPFISQFAYQAALAAYRDCAAWHEDLLSYLRLNHDYLFNEINYACPGWKMHPLEATYLAWIDVRNCSVPQLKETLEKAGVGLMDGAVFNGPGFLRMNFACPQAQLEDAVNRIKRIF